MFGVLITMLLIWLLIKVFRITFSLAWGFLKVTALIMGIVAAVLLLVGITLSAAVLMLASAVVAAIALLILRLLR